MTLPSIYGHDWDDLPYGGGVEDPFEEAVVRQRDVRKDRTASSKQTQEIEAVNPKQTTLNVFDE